MKKRTIYDVCVFPKDTNSTTHFWFQGGKLTDNVDFSRRASTNKIFRTRKKLETFFRWLDKAYPDVYMCVYEHHPYSHPIMYEIPMGDNWREWKNPYV